ncbi:MAG TPA: hypothetical protein VFY13_03110, partial [Luteolibacter sp.]|nr:hypothetical protein [Luteolibacter sp.]
MTDQSTAPKGGKPRFPWWGMGFFVLACGAVGLCFSSFPGKVKRALEGMIQPRVIEVVKPVPDPDREAIRRQVEERLRADYERKFQNELKSELAKIEEQADERVEKIEQAYLDKPRQYHLPEGPIQDVRKLRSGIRWETSVEVEKGGLASVEREDDESYTARYQLKLRLPEASKTMPELEKLTPGLSAILPGLDVCLQQAKVSD